MSLSLDFTRERVSPFGGIATSSSIANITTVSIDPEFLILYALISLAVTSFFGGLVIGVIKDGSEKQGIRYVPILMALSIALFYSTRFIAAAMFVI